MDYSRHPWRSPEAAFGVRSGILPPQSGSDGFRHPSGM